MIRTKPLTERGSIFNHVGGQKILRQSTNDYAIGMSKFFLMKELKEYVSRFEWKNLPPGVNANILETMLYYKGQLAFFKVAEHYYILPFVYTGPINHYGVQEKLIPISFNGTVEDDINNITKFAGEKIAYVYEKADMDDPVEDVAVVLRAGSGMFLSYSIPPVLITEQIRAKLVENLILIRNNLILSQPIKYINVMNEAAAKSIQLQVDTMLNDILNGNVVQTIVGNLTLEDINTEVSKLVPQQLWQSLESLNSLRLDYLGILNNGVFEKRERFLTDEIAGKQATARLLLQDDLNNRKIFCKLVNKVFGLNVSVDINKDLIPPVKEEEPDMREVSNDVEI